MVSGYPVIDLLETTGYRLVNSKYPPIALFEDVADAEEFESLYQIQALTNPRLLNDAGSFNILKKDEIPFGINGCSYAVAPFTHINPEGSRFSNGNFGVLYIADSMETALAEVRYHQNLYWSKVKGLKDDIMIFRGLKCSFTSPKMLDATTKTLRASIYHSEDYSQAQTLGSEIKNKRLSGIRYHSVRNKSATCWGLFTPKYVKRIIQAKHYQFIWQDGITAIQKVESL